VQKPASIGNNSSNNNNNDSNNNDNNDSTDSIYDFDAPTTTTNRDDANSMKSTTALSPLLLPSPEVEFLDSVPVYLPYIALPGSEFNGEEDEDISTVGDYFFLLPDNFVNRKSPRINGNKGLEDLASLSYSEFNEDEDDDGSVSALIMEEFEDSDSLDTSTTTLVTIAAENNAMDEQDGVANSPPIIFTESTQVLLNEEVIENDYGGSTTTAEQESAVSNDDELFHGDEWDDATCSTTAPFLLGSIWVKHPKHGCMVRRSSRLIVLSRLSRG
jgi:hypothetical protein